MARQSFRQLVIEARRRKVFRSVGLYIVAIWVLLQVAALAFDTWGIKASALRYVWIGALVGLPLVVILAWNLQLADRGLVRFDDSKSEHDLLALVWRDWVVLSLIGAIVIATVLGVTSDIGRDEAGGGIQAGAPEIGPDGRIYSIAVLPFRDFSSNSTRPYLAEGISEAILHVLAQNKDLLVTARTSSFFFKGKDVTAAEIGRILGVQALLEGSVQIEDDKLRVTSQLVRTSDQSHIWSEVYESDVENIFEVQDDIAYSVRSLVLSGGVMNEPERDEGRYPSLEAYELVLESKKENFSDLESIESAIRKLQLSIQLSPSYADAYVYLSIAFTKKLDRLLERDQISAGEYKQLNQDRQSALDIALELEPENALAILQQGRLSQDSGGEQYEIAQQRSLEIAPNDPEVLRWSSELAFQDLDLRKARDLISRARLVEPSSTDILDDWIFVHCRNKPAMDLVEAHIQNYELPVVERIALRREASFCDGDITGAMALALQQSKLEDTRAGYLSVIGDLALLGDANALRQYDQLHWLLPGLFGNKSYDGTVFFNQVAGDRLAAYTWAKGKTGFNLYFANIPLAAAQLQVREFERARETIEETSNSWAEYYSHRDQPHIMLQTLAIYSIKAWLHFEAGDETQSVALSRILLASLADRDLLDWEDSNGVYDDLPLLVLVLNGQLGEAVTWLEGAEAAGWMEFQAVVSSPLYSKLRENEEATEILSRLVARRDATLSSVQALSLPELSDPALLVDLMSRQQVMELSDSEVDKAKEHAKEVAEMWLATLDNGEWSQSYAGTSQYFKEEVTEEEWILTMDSVRGRYPSVQSRRILNAGYFTEAPNAPPGHYISLRYSTNFLDGQLALEYVAIIKDVDGEWRPVGYNLAD